MTPSPASSASSHIFISRCLGNLALGNDYRCHPTCEPGGYDVGFAMMLLNEHQPFATFEEAKAFALMFQKQVEIAIRYDRRSVVEGKAAKYGTDIASWTEVGVFGGRDAYATAEHHLAKLKEPLQIVGGLRRSTYGWIARGAPSLDRVSYKWPVWEKRTNRLFLVVPPKGQVIQLPKAESIASALEAAREEHGLVPVYEVSPDYDILTNAGLDDLRAESVVTGYLTQIKVARSSLEHGFLHPDYVDRAREIIERAYEAASRAAT